MLFTCLKKHTSLLVKAIPCTELCHILKMQSKKRKKKKVQMRKFHQLLLGFESISLMKRESVA